ncbi:cupin domain-containing protein [Flavobacterium sp.]|uniref:cupin domain-containing protein n=1 Tax=Flavobacterium sp. TaxID=239 RepID=UPI003C5A1628
MQSFGASKEFLIGDEIKWEVAGEGVRRKIMGYDDKIMLVNVEFSKGSVGALHEHYHSQVTYVVSGQFEVTIGDDKKILKGGDCFYIPPHVLHGAICLEEGILIDVFSPIREDFMKTGMNY